MFMINKKISALRWKIMSKRGNYRQTLDKLIKKRNKLDEVYYDESDPMAFDGDCIMQLHDLADDAISLAIDGIPKEED